MTDIKQSPLNRAAQIISDFFSPIVLPAYMMAIAMWATPLVAIPERVRFVAMGIVVVLTAILPTAAIFTLIRLGRVSDVSLSNRSERTLPYVISIVCYIATLIYLCKVRAPYWLSSFYLGAAVTSLFAVLITLKWKVSAHASAIGGVAAAVLWMSFHDVLTFGEIYWTSGTILLCGAVGTARLILKRHTVSQVFAGYVLGAAVVYITLCLF